MAFIYRYHLRSSKDRERRDLTIHEQQIIQALNYLFASNLKDSRVSKEYFEFKLYKSVDNSTLQEMGRYLAPYFRAYYDRYSGFIRVQQEFYAFLYHFDNAEDGYDYLELIDIADIEELIDIDKRETFNARAKEYARKFLAQNNAELNVDEIGAKLANVFYLDVTGAYIKANFFKNSSIIQNVSLLKIRGNHINDSSKVNIDNMRLIRLENELNKDVANINGQESTDTASHFDYLIVTDENVIGNSEEKHRQIDDALNLESSFVGSEEIEALKNINEKNIIFTVHYLGQGLSTSLRYDGEEYCFLFFDFGAAEGVNTFTRPKGISGNVNTNSTIILSHIHNDHWYRLVLDKNAFKCKWCIPSQRLNYTFNHKCSEILLSGGNVQRITKSIVFNGGSLFCGDISKTNPTRKAVHKHETGLGLRLEAISETGGELNILIPGDQQYDYINNALLSDIDILVATHHGGKYSWSKRKTVISDIPAPRNKDRSLVIYSYGHTGAKQNTYGHPSKTLDYGVQNWINRHDTPILNDYSIKIRVR